MQPGHSHSPRPARRGAVLPLPILLAAVLSLLVAGCSSDEVLPGADMRGPRVLERLPAGAPGWVQASTDPTDDGWDELVEAAGFDAGTDTVERLLGSAAGSVLATERRPVEWQHDVAPWIGDDFGLALTTGDIDAPEAVVGWAEVGDVDALEHVLRERGWRRGSSDTALHGLRAWRPPSDASGSLPWIGVGGDLVLAARDPDSLSAVVDSAAKRSAAQEVQTLGEILDSAKARPISMFVRGASLRQALSIRAGGNAANFEAAKTVYSSTPWISAAKGAMFDVTAHDGSIRVDSHMLYRGLDLGQRLLDPVALGMLGELPSDAAAGAALEDPGILLDGVLTGAQHGGSEFTTELDRPGSDADVPLADVLDTLDGDAALGIAGGADRAGGAVLHAIVEDDPEQGPTSGDAVRAAFAALTRTVDTIARSFDVEASVNRTDEPDAVTGAVEYDVPALTTQRTLIDVSRTQAPAPRGGEAVPLSSTLAEDPAWGAAWKRADVPKGPVAVGWIAPRAWASCGGPLGDLRLPWFGGPVPISPSIDGPVPMWLSWSEEDGELSFRADIRFRRGGTCEARPASAPR